MTCFAPALTITSSGATSKPCARLSHAATAWRSCGVPSTGVYFVAPPSSAFFAASLMCAGVSKSGSPAPKLTTSIPLARSSAALAATFRVMEGSTPFSLFASFISSFPPLSCRVTADRGHLFYQRRRDIERGGKPLPFA